MSFDDIQGAAVVRASQGPLDALLDFMNAEFSGDTDTGVERSRAADIALAVGINQSRRETDRTDEERQFNLSSLDKHGMMKVIIEERHPERSGQELRNILQEYLEGGVQEIGEQFESSGVFKYHQYLPDDRGLEPETESST